MHPVEAQLYAFLTTIIVCFGEILYFCHHTSPLALIERFSVLREGTLSDIELPKDKRMNPHLLNHIILKVQKLSLSSELLAIPVSSILPKCILIPVRGADFHYIIALPNQVERH